MPPTLQDYFGTSVQLTTDASAKAIAVIYLEDFAAEGLAIPGTLTDIKASAIAATFIIKWLSLSVGKEDDPTYGVTVGSPRAGLTERGGMPQKSYSFDTTIYLPDNSPAIPDPDAVV